MLKFDKINKVFTFDFEQVSTEDPKRRNLNQFILLSLNGCSRLWELTSERLAEIDSVNSVICSEETESLLQLDETHILQATKTHL